MSGKHFFFAERKGLTPLIPRRASHKKINARHFMPDPFLFYSLDKLKSLPRYIQRLTPLIPRGASHKEINARHFMPDPFLFYSLDKLKVCHAIKQKMLPLQEALFFCREDGIRTHDAVTHILAFQASSFNHSDTSLFYLRLQITIKKMS